MPIEDAITQAMSAMDSAGNDQPQDEQVEESVDADELVTEEDSDEDLDEENDEDLDDESDDTEGDSGPVELDEDQEVVINGKKGTVRDLLELKADYTRKTQELAEERKKVEAREQEIEQVYTQLSEWYTSRAKNPSGFVTEIVSAAGDPTTVLAVALKELAESGVLDPEFVKVFGLTAPENPVSRRSQAKAEDDRVAQLEQKLAEREQREAAEVEQRKLMESYERQLANIVAEEELSFSTEEELQQFRIELLTFAKESGLVDDLEVAYAVMARSRAKTAREREAQTRQTVTKKRKAQVVSRKSAGAAAPEVPEKVKGGDVEAAVRLALTRLSGGSSS